MGDGIVLGQGQGTPEGEEPPTIDSCYSINMECILFDNGAQMTTMHFFPTPNVPFGVMQYACASLLNTIAQASPDGFEMCLDQVRDLAMQQSKNRMRGA